MNSGPGGGVAGQGAIIVPASVVHVPIQETRIEAIPFQPVSERYPVQLRESLRIAKFQRHRKCRTLSKLREAFLQALKLFSIFRSQANRGFNSVLPASIQKQSLLR